MLFLVWKRDLSLRAGTAVKIASTDAGQIPYFVLLIWSPSEGESNTYASCISSSQIINLAALTMAYVKNVVRESEWRSKKGKSLEILNRFLGTWGTRLMFLCCQSVDKGNMFVGKSAIHTYKIRLRRLIDSLYIHEQVKLTVFSNSVANYRHIPFCNGGLVESSKFRSWADHFRFQIRSSNKQKETQKKTKKMALETFLTLTILPSLARNPHCSRPFSAL